jgi:heat shock protein HslJ
LPRITTSLAACGLAVVTALFLGGCASHADGGGPDPQLRGQWQLTSARDFGGRLDLANQHITLTIDGDTSTSGRSACSNYRAQLFGTIHALWVRTELPKRIDCGSQVQQTIEERYMAALANVRSASVDGGVLVLTAPDVNLRYAKALARPVVLLVGHSWTLSSMASVYFFDAGIQGDDPASKFLLNATLRFGAHGEIRGQTGCLNFFGHVTQDAGEMLVDKLVKSTPVPCSSMDGAVSDNFFRVLESAFTFHAGGDSLTLVSSRVGIVLDFAQTS